ncbi:magnesium/cobalt transporter CorA [Mesobacillus zeae]|uniref:Magnesium transport protein CorA n=1 Tax=Mesobacillus zeae TaxID=1917180 RepID=A0A398BKN7_9BACI|nr:magnesium/cobalt transporter CorA [Mesobacillus zeae]RID88320.1 magnesium and cobalt transport protein CorA [Mesobacillus zeae]
MIRTIAITKDGKIVKDVPPEMLVRGQYNWFWVDFDVPEETEMALLSETFHFHPLAIEDCIHTLQRPKLDYYEDHTFFVVHKLDPKTLGKEEVDIFLGDSYIVTYHNKSSMEVDEVWNRLLLTKTLKKWNPGLAFYHVLDKIVDNYFPIVYSFEDALNELEDNSKGKSMELLLDQLFDIRHDLLSFRHTVVPMRDLVYRMLNSHRLTTVLKQLEYFHDIHDHLLKLNEMTESNRELTTDIRDSYLSMNAHETNRVMKVLTVITTIFMPLTFIAGLYGMNFQHMPELQWHYGYFMALFAMATIGGVMFLFFKNKGWFK